jgi:hypothetical protein
VLTDPAVFQIAELFAVQIPPILILLNRLRTISAGLYNNFKGDHEQLAIGMIIYDALYSWDKHVQIDSHTWKSN